MSEITSAVPYPPRMGEVEWPLPVEKLGVKWILTYLDGGCVRTKLFDNPIEADHILPTSYYTEFDGEKTVYKEKDEGGNFHLVASLVRSSVITTPFDTAEMPTLAFFEDYDIEVITQPLTGDTIHLPFRSVGKCGVVGREEKFALVFKRYDIIRLYGVDLYWDGYMFHEVMLEHVETLNVS